MSLWSTASSMFACVSRKKPGLPAFLGRHIPSLSSAFCILAIQHSCRHVLPRYWRYEHLLQIDDERSEQLNLGGYNLVTLKRERERECWNAMNLWGKNTWETKYIHIYMTGFFEWFGIKTMVTILIKKIKHPSILLNWPSSKGGESASSSTLPMAAMAKGPFLYCKGGPKSFPNLWGVGYAML